MNAPILGLIRRFDPLEVMTVRGYDRLVLSYIRGSDQLDVVTIRGYGIPPLQIVWRFIKIQNMKTFIIFKSPFFYIFGGMAKTA